MIHGCQDIKQKPCLNLFGTPCRGSIMIYMSWRISLDISLSTYHFWYVTLAISLLTYHYWHVNLYFSILICYSCLVTIDLSLLMSLLTCHSWHVTFDMSLLTCHSCFISLDLSWDRTWPYATVLNNLHGNHVRFCNFKLLRHSLTVSSYGCPL